MASYLGNHSIGIWNMVNSEDRSSRLMYALLPARHGTRFHIPKIFILICTASRTAYLLDSRLFSGYIIFFLCQFWISWAGWRYLYISTLFLFIELFLICIRRHCSCCQMRTVFMLEVEAVPRLVLILVSVSEICLWRALTWVQVANLFWWGSA